jgi:hypothetical protein
MRLAGTKESKFNPDLEADDAPGCRPSVQDTIVQAESGNVRKGLGKAETPARRVCFVECDGPPPVLDMCGVWVGSTCSCGA